MKKVMIKCYNSKTKTSDWVHLCYVPNKLWNEFKRNVTSEYPINEYLERWVVEDFAVGLRINSIEDLSEMKALIKNKAQTQYPHLYLKTKIDSQGWVRVWVTEKMMKERNKR